MKDDSLLVFQTVAGDEQAFRLLVQKYYKRIYTQILSIVHNFADAEELTNDTFFKAYLNISSLQHPESFYAWLCQIARHCSQNWLRQCRETHLSLEEALSDIETGLFWNSTQEWLTYKEKLDKTFEAIELLSKEDKELIQDFYFNDVPYKKLEQQYSLSKSAINMRLTRARTRIRELVKRLFPGIVFPLWRDVTEKALVGGMESVKASLKMKLATTGVVTLLMACGIGISIWQHQQLSRQGIILSKQTEQKTSIITSKDLLPKKVYSASPVQEDKSLRSANSATEMNKANFELWLSELEAKHNVVSEEKIIKDTSSTSDLSIKQQQRLQEIESMITNYASEYHELVKITKNRDMEHSEFGPIQNRMDFLVESVGMLATEYNTIVPYSLFDPNSRIRQLIKGVAEIGNVVIYDSSSSQDKSK